MVQNISEEGWFNRKPEKAHFMLTKAGKGVLESGEEINNGTLRKFPSFIKFIDGDTKKAKDSSEEKEV